MAAAVPDRLLRPGRGHGLRARTSASVIGEPQPALRRRRRHVVRHQHRHRRPADGQHDVRARARPDRQRALDRDLEPRRRRRRRSSSISRAGEIQVGPGSAGADPGPACYGKGGTEPTMTDACLLIGILDPGRFAGGSMRLDADARRRQAFEAPGHARSTSASASRYAYQHGPQQHRRGHRRHRRSSHGIDPRDYSPGGLRRRRADDAAARCSTRRACEQVDRPAAPGPVLRARAAVARDLVYADSRSAYTVLSADAAERGRRRSSPQMEDGLRAASSATAATGVEFARSLRRPAASARRWETPFVDGAGRRRSTPRRSTHDDRELPRRLRAAHRQPLRRAARSRASPTACRPKVPIEKVDYPPIDRRNGGAPEPGARSRCATSTARR